MEIEVRTCADCGCDVAPLDMFPKDRCLGCHAKVYDAMPPPTARELARMWGANV